MTTTDISLGIRAVVAALLGGALVLAPPPPSARAVETTVATPAALAAALASAASGDRVVLGKGFPADVVLDDALVVPPSRTVTLDLGEHEVRVVSTHAAGAVVIGGAATLEVVGSGTLEVVATAAGAPGIGGAGAIYVAGAGVVASAGAGGDAVRAETMVHAAGRLVAVGGAAGTAQDGGAGVRGTLSVFSGATADATGGPARTAAAAGPGVAGAVSVDQDGRVTAAPGAAGAGSASSPAVDGDVGVGRGAVTLTGATGPAAASVVAPETVVDVGPDGVLTLASGRWSIGAGRTAISSGLIVTEATVEGPGTLANYGTVLGGGAVTAPVVGNTYLLRFEVPGGGEVPDRRVYAGDLASAQQTWPVPPPASPEQLFLGWSGRGREDLVVRTTTLADLAEPGGDVPLVARWADLRIDGVPRVGETLTATLDPDPDEVPRPDTSPVDVSYRWSADGEEVPGATGPTLLIADELAGATVAVEVAIAPRAGHDPAAPARADVRVEGGSGGPGPGPGPADGPGAPPGDGPGEGPGELDPPTGTGAPPGATGPGTPATAAPPTAAGAAPATLPATGVAVTGLLAAAGTLLVGGVGLRIAHRRR